MIAVMFSLFGRLKAYVGRGSGVAVVSKLPSGSAPPPMKYADTNALAAFRKSMPCSSSAVRSRSATATSSRIC